MSSKKLTDSAIDLNIPYEQNEIQLKGILGFGVGLLLLIVITFGLMWAFLNTLRDYSKENAGPANPVAQTERERLPPEPRIQSAPGFGVPSDTGWVNMELSAPQSEYWELSRQWKELWEKGRKDPKSGVVTAMPISVAKEKLLSQNVKARSGADAEKLYSKSQMSISESSAGRVASDMRR